MATPHQARIQRQADLAFLVLLEMRSGGSLARLERRLADVGVTIPLSRLKRWSSRFGWQARLAALEAEAAKRRSEHGVESLLAMLERHAQLGRALQHAGGSALQQLLQDEPRLAELRPAEITRLLDLGLRAERQAGTEASDRRALGTAIWNTVIREVVTIFRAVNDEPGRDARARVFARRVDALVGTQLDALADPEGNHDVAGR